MFNQSLLAAAGMDLSEGLACCADDAEFYDEMILEYVKESDTRLKDLRVFFDQKDWRQYGICAHSLKSTSRMIGLLAFSEQARTMELAAKNEDEATLTAEHGSFLQTYAGLIEQIRKAKIQ